MTEIAGILNGTTNFILTKMIREHMAFADALKLAQQLATPSGTLRRCGGCRCLPEICILASLPMAPMCTRWVHTEALRPLRRRMWAMRMPGAGSSNSLER